jgi:hypothetical protein
MNQKDLEILIDYLADLSLNADTFEIALSALKLQTLLKAHYNV